MRVTAISAYVPQYRHGRSTPVRETVTIPLAPAVEATPSQIAGLVNRGLLVDVLC